MLPALNVIQSLKPLNVLLCFFFFGGVIIPAQQGAAEQNTRGLLKVIAFIIVN